MKINLLARMLPLGDSAMTFQFGTAITRETNARVMAAKKAVEAACLAGVVETVPTFCSLTVHFDPAVTRFDDMAETVGALEIGEAVETSGREWKIPVVYDGPDLAQTAQLAGLTVEAIINLHAQTVYHVYMLGFLPGFAYLGDLPAPLRLPRLEVPRTHVPAGSVAIADQLTAIYPLQSPGGWRLIGRTPLRLFDPARTPPSLFQPGDAVRFVPSGKEIFDADAYMTDAGR